jgi:hypothetical protein
MMTEFNRLRELAKEELSPYNKRQEQIIRKQLSEKLSKLASKTIIGAIASFIMWIIVLYNLVRAFLDGGF